MTVLHQVSGISASTIAGIILAMSVTGIWGWKV